MLAAWKTLGKILYEYCTSVPFWVTILEMFHDLHDHPASNAVTHECDPAGPGNVVQHEQDLVLHLGLKAVGVGG